MLASTHVPVALDIAPNLWRSFLWRKLFNAIERFDSIQNAKIFRCENLRVLLDHMLGTLCAPLLCTSARGRSHCFSDGKVADFNRDSAYFGEALFILVG